MQIGKAIITAMLLAPAVALADIPDWQTSPAGVRYVSGGVGQEERTGMEQRYGTAAMRISNVVEGSGAFLSGVVISVTDSGGTELLKAKSDGPWFFVELPSGSYTVRSEMGDAAQTRNVQVDSLRQQRVIFRWVKTTPDPEPQVVPRQKPLPPEMTQPRLQKQPPETSATPPSRTAPESKRGARQPAPQQQQRPTPKSENPEPYFCPPGNEFDPECL